MRGLDDTAHNLYTPGAAPGYRQRSGVAGAQEGVRRKVEFHLFSPERAPMPIAPAALGESIEEMMAARGIHYHPLFTFEQLETGYDDVDAIGDVATIKLPNGKALPSWL